MTPENQRIFSANYHKSLQKISFSARATALQVTYSTDVLKHVFGILERLKQFPNFKDIGFGI